MLHFLSPSPTGYFIIFLFFPSQTFFLKNVDASINGNTPVVPGQPPDYDGKISFNPDGQVILMPGIWDEGASVPEA